MNFKQSNGIDLYQYFSAPGIDMNSLHIML